MALAAIMAVLTLLALASSIANGQPSSTPPESIEPKGIQDLNSTLLQNASYQDRRYSVSMAALLRLMALTEDACEGLQWCTVHSATTDTEVVRGGCEECSCDSSCVDTQSCCPDFRLSQILRDNITRDIYTSVTDMEAGLMDYENYTVRENVDVLYDEFKEIDGLKLRCIESRLKRKSVFLTSSSYYMVATCGNVTDEEDVRLCESTDISTLSNRIWDFIPVQSTVNGVVYKNKYCFRCNRRAGDAFQHWDALLTNLQTSTTFLHNAMPSIELAMEFIINSQTDDLVFEPSTQQLMTSPPMPCAHYDVGTCHVDSQALTAHVHVDGACERFVYPALARNGSRSLTKYKNLACLACHMEITDEESVSYLQYRKWTQSAFFAKLEFGSAKYEVFEGNTDNASHNTSILQQFNSPNCRSGQVFDGYMDVCRQVHCPCGMMALNFTCIPVFREIYNRKIQASVLVTIVDYKDDNPYHLADSLWKYFQTSITSYANLKVESVFIYYDFTRETSFVCFVRFIGDGNKVLYLDVVSLVEKWNKPDRKSICGAAVTMALTNAFTFKEKTAQNVGSGHTYKRIFLTIDTTIESGHIVSSYITITECSFCFRLELLKNETIPWERKGVILKRTGEHIPLRDSVGVVLGNHMSLFCADVLFGTSINNRHLSSWKPFLDTTHNETADSGKGSDGASVNKSTDGQDGSYKGLSAIVCLLVVACSVCVVWQLRGLRRSHRAETN